MKTFLKTTACQHLPSLDVWQFDNLVGFPMTSGHFACSPLIVWSG